MKKIINTSKAAAPIGPYNQAVIANGMVFTSGQIALAADSGKLITASIEAETEQVMNNLKAVLHEAGSDFSKVIKSSIFLKDMGQFDRVNTIYAKYFDEATAPARETVQVAALPKNVNIEISVIALVG